MLKQSAYRALGIHASCTRVFNVWLVTRTLDLHGLQPKPVHFTAAGEFQCESLPGKLLAEDDRLRELDAETA